jgi:hypothetical protein
MSAVDVERNELAWRKASYSAGNGECVEVANTPGGRVAIRDSKAPGGVMLGFAPAAFRSLVNLIKLDDLPFK